MKCDSERPDTICAWSKEIGGDMKINRISADLIKDDINRMTFESGDIILLRDISEDTAAAMPEIIKNLHAQGLKCVTLSEMLL